MKSRRFIAMLIVVATIVITMLIVNMPQEEKDPQENEVKISISTTTEDLILEKKGGNEFFYVKGIENKLEPIECSTVDQFVNLSCKDRNIYVTFETGDSRTVFWKGSEKVIQQYKFTKKYWVFAKDGEGNQEAVIFIWTDRYDIEYENNKYNRLIFFVIILSLIALFVCIFYKENPESD